MYFGLRLAIDKGIQDIVVEMDAATAVLIQKPDLLCYHPLATLLLCCCDLMDHFVTCSLQHIYREKKGVADSLSNWSYNMDLGLHIFASAPSWLG